MNHHLTNSCLGDAEDGRIQEEVLRAKESQEKWAREGRVKNFSQWLDCYFVHIRAEYLKAQNPERDDRGRFFLGASGVPLSNPTADVQRLRQKYVMRLQERAVLPPEPQVGLMVDAPQLICGRGSTTHAGELHLPQQPSSQLLGAFEDWFPITLHGKPLTRVQAAEAGFMELLPLLEEASVQAVGFIATMEFKRDQDVSDYHGEVVSKQEGEQRLETLTREPSYVFFFTGKGGEPLYIDAQTRRLMGGG
ncbi:hypothetical protein cypCar_00047372 [Cyprinus carpio]|nr:hypothetical protein cypCar_00047372 [Cyprinus carpio]